MLAAIRLLSSSFFVGHGFLCAANVVWMTSRVARSSHADERERAKRKRVAVRGVTGGGFQSAMVRAQARA
jgi:hypothetical protein